MRKFVLMLAALVGMSVAVPALAEMTSAQKDECILVSTNCKNAVDDIQTKMAKISKEIAKGDAVYTPDELKKLEQKLAEVKKLMDDLQRH